MSTHIRKYFTVCRCANFKMSGKELDDMTFEKIKFWKVSALKNFLRKRNLSCAGTKKMLVARVFAACEKNISVEKTASEREKILAQKFS